MNNSQQQISAVCDEVKNMLLEKNMKYGDSAINPVRFLSKSSNVEQILVRIDDKLNRLSQGHTDDDEDVINDLIGYLVLLKVAKKTNLTVKEVLDFNTPTWYDNLYRDDPYNPYPPQSRCQTDSITIF